MKYQNIIKHIEGLIKDRSLTSGSKLPSVRILAHELNCSKSTVIKAYETLVKNKLAYSIDKSGYFLMNNPETRLISDRIEFHKTSCQKSVIQKNDMQILINKSFDNITYFEDQDIEGHYPLREQLKYYFRKKKVFAGSHDIFIMPTFIQCIHSILSINGLNEGILVEDPIDKSVASLFKTKKNIHVLSRENPIDFNLLELMILKDKIKILFITPHIHIPTGVSMELSEKQQLIDICLKYDVKIVEINHFEDAFSFDESQSLYALDKNEIVFHIKSFNNFISNDINVVALISPKAYTSKVKYYKEVVLGKTTLFEQLLLTQYFLSDMTSMPLILKQTDKFEILKNYLKSFDEFEVQLTDAPLFAFVKVPFHFNLETVVLELNKENIIIESVKDYFIKEHLFKGFILSVNTVTKHNLHDGLLTIKHVLDANRR